MGKIEGTESGPALYMVELSVSDWPGTVRWYREVLGLVLVAEDAARRFALLSAGGLRVALKGDGGTVAGARLAFEVSDVDGEFARLKGLGMEVTEPADHPHEPYREVRLRDPEGVPITVFGWLQRRVGVAPVDRTGSSG